MITDAIYTILSGNATLTAQVSTRIYPADAPQTTANPCVIYEISGQEPEYSKEGAATVIYTNLEVDVFADSYRQSRSIADLIKSALDQYSGTVNGHNIDLVQWEGTTDSGVDADRREYRASMGFRIREK